MAGVLLVLCRFFAFLASFLLGIRRFSASFLLVLLIRRFLHVLCRCSEVLSAGFLLVIGRFYASVLLILCTFFALCFVLCEPNPE